MDVFRILVVWLRAAGGTVAIVAIVWLLAQSLFHLRLLDVQTGSMRPTFWPHDALVMQQIGENQLRPGMVVSYKSPRNPNELVTHRVAKLLPATHSMQTKGDALSVADPVVRDSLVVGRVVAILPNLGRPLNWLHSWSGLVMCVYVPAAAITAYELRKLEQNYKQGRFYTLVGA